ncbi:RNA exonuclease 1 homolog [Brachyhypopomus gauderio]|uniref:RNA exonuclease 1 homolog n=1 Tax=Brachyhypopomus gauderio TaxID=698409 RepID=UPI0040417248
MLRSTGFFRGIDCPFYAESSNGGLGCSRPYCHFRHSKQRRASVGPHDTRNAKDGFANPNDQGYDPFSPEVVRPAENCNAESSSDPSTGPAVDLGTMELELVNRAIAAVRCEMEKDKQKLSRIGEQVYELGPGSTKAGQKRQASAAALAHTAYDPGSYQMGQADDYNPTPRSSKYTLDSDTSSSPANSMEYVPTAVSKPGLKKTAPALTSRNPPTSPKCKYTLDNSRPSTDMEYDPLSNFSAKPGSKGGKELAGVGADAEGRKRARSSVSEQQGVDKEYEPTPKKARPPPPERPKYTASFTESDGENSGTEYRPTPVNRLKRRKSSTSSMEESGRRVMGGAGGVGGGAGRQPAAARRPRAESTESDDGEQTANGKPLEKKLGGHSGRAKTGQSEKPKKENKDSGKKSDSLKVKTGSDRVEKLLKKPSQDSARKEKSHRKTTDEKVKATERHSERAGKDGKEWKNKRTEKERGGKERGSGDAKKLKTEKTDQRRKESGKCKEPRNGMLESAVRAKLGSSVSSKVKRSSSSLGEGGVKEKTKKATPHSLSHAVLFGDESPEEEEEEEEDDRIVRKSASAFKRSGLLNHLRKGSDAAASSAEDEDASGCERKDDDDDGADADFAALVVDADYDSDPMEECLRIFNESKDVKTEDKGRQAKQPPKEEGEDEDTQSTLTTLFPGQKKRVSHFKAKGAAETSRNTLPRPQRRMTAQEMCYQRMQIARQQAAELAAAAKSVAMAPGPGPAPNPAPSRAFPGEKRRVMHRPNPALISAKPGLSKVHQPVRGVLSPNSAVPDPTSVKAHTSASMLSKTTFTTAQKRVAHMPTLKSSTMKRPVVPAEFGAKVPTNIRQRYLNVFIDECLKFCPSEEIAFQTALDEEKLVYERSNSKNIYLNVAVNTLKKLRNKSGAPASPSTKKTPTPINRRAQSHEGVLGGRLAATTSYTINRMGKHQNVDLQGASLYWKLKAYVLTEEQLQEHSYPRPHPDRLGHAMLYNVPEKKNVDPFSKVCCRCGAEYKINANGNCVRKEECSHHWGRLRRYRVPGGWETQYSCCSGAVGSPGCQVVKQHVQDGRKDSLDGYVKTFNKPLPPDGNGGVYALDCEMCYTKQGLELTRVTVIDSSLKVVYDTFVKPESTVVDYNTRFSGVTEEDLENATMRLRDVQAVLLNMLSSESILIGHSLESDLFALKLLHSTVVDTAIVFPHRLGLPYKRALRNLMADYLKRIIQDNVEGHDSSEDAAACMELMMWKIKEDAKVKR